jgi:hypothetical protein
MALRCLARLSLLAGAAALPTYDSEGNLQTDFFHRGVAPAAAAGKSSHLKVMTFYGGTADELHGWANVMRDSIDACDNKTITEKWKMKILVELGADVFDRSKHALHPGWKNATDTFIATVKPHVASGKALGVFMGDEICCGGTPYSNLSSVAARLKAGLPDAWICKLAHKTDSTARLTGVVAVEGRCAARAAIVCAASAKVLTSLLSRLLWRTNRHQRVQ